MQMLSLVFTEALFVVAYNHEQVCKVWQSSAVEYYAAMNKEESILDGITLQISKIHEK